MADKDKAIYGLEVIKKKGADRAHVVLSDSASHELSMESGDSSMLRTTYNQNIRFRVLKGNKKGDYSVNKLDTASIDKAAETALTIAEASQEDPAYGIAEKQPPGEFSTGPLNPDLDLMYEKLTSFLKTTNQAFPKTIIQQSVIEFTTYHYTFLNTNGVNFTTNMGIYAFWVMFTSRDGEKATSFNYSSFFTRDLNKELIDYGSTRTLLEQSAGQLDVKNIGAKFDGDILITPDCLGSFIGFFISKFLSDYSLISGTSIYKDSLDKQVANPCFTLHAAPLSKEIAYNYFVTSDGYRADNCTIIERGILKTFLLSLYGANKTDKKRAVNNGGCYVVDPGPTPREEMVTSIKKGLLVCRISGGRPNDKGDFSVVAKNSYYIEDGRVLFPVNEIMITGNIADLFHNIKTVSSERINFGTTIYPWVLAGGLTISGK